MRDCSWLPPGKLKRDTVGCTATYMNFLSAVSNAHVVRRRRLSYGAVQSDHRTLQRHTVLALPNTSRSVQPTCKWGRTEKIRADELHPTSRSLKASTPWFKISPTFALRSLPTGRCCRKTRGSETTCGLSPASSSKMALIACFRHFYLPPEILIRL